MEVKSEVWTHLAWKGGVWTCQRERRNSRMVEKAPRLDYIYYSISAFSAWWLSWLKVCKLKNILIEFLNFQTLLYCQNNVKDISFLPCQSRQKNKVVRKSQNCRLHNIPSASLSLSANCFYKCPSVVSLKMFAVSCK